MILVLRVLFISSIHFSQDSTQQFSSHHDVAMDLINSVTGVDEEGRSRQRILSFAAKRFGYIASLSSVS
jgi:cytochrome c-type biogenesis protein CcmH/NrfF